MSFWDNVSDTVNKLGQDAKKAMDLRSLNKKIKDCEAEEAMCFNEMGRIYYHNLKNENANSAKRLTELAENIDNLRFRVNQLSKQFSEIKNDLPKPEKAETIKPVESAPQRLSRNESDLRIRRTQTGIIMVRLCPGCKTENPSSADVCSKCGNNLHHPA